jgi:hypothetical protein
MAAGLGFKTFNTGDVLSAADTNGYLMQGVWVFANATARDAAVTSPQEGNTCYLKDTDVIQVYSGSSWVTKSGGSSPLTTKGDLYTYSTTDTRLASSGVNNDVLTVDTSTATGLKWAAPAGGGGATLISTTTLSGATTTVGSIPSTYKSIYCIVDTPQNGTADGVWRCRPNNDTAVKVAGSYTNLTTSQSFYDDGNGIPLSFTQNALRGNGDSYAFFQIENYASTAITRKGIYGYGTFRNSSNSGNLFGIYGGSHYLFNTAITSLVFLNTGGNSIGGTVYLYGVN